MFNHFLNSRFRLWWLVSGCWLLITAGIRPLMLPDEGRYVGVAWEMLSQQQWWVPTLDGMPFFHKPPLFYWLTLLGIKIFGMSEWAARMASWSSAWLAAVVMVSFLRKHGDVRLSNVSMLVLLTMPFYFIGAQFANLDMLVASMISLCILFSADAALCMEQHRPHQHALALAYVFAALGLLSKGLIGLVLPGATVVAWLLLRRQHRLIIRMWSWPLMGLFALIAAPWFVWMEHTYPGFGRYFFYHHHFQRFAATGFNNQQPFWFYVPVLLVLTFPVSVNVWRMVRPTFYLPVKANAIRTLMLVWMGVVLVFFSLPQSKLIGYILPTLIPFAVLLASTWDAHSNQTSSSAPKHALWIFVGAGLLCLGLVFGLSKKVQSNSHTLPDSVRQQFEPQDQLVMLDRYAYDLPFYLRARHPAWVVSNWQDPDIPKFDNWRKEIFDAAWFAPEEGRKNLIDEHTLMQRLCTPENHGLWIWGPQNTPHPWLQTQAPVFSASGHSLWHISSQQWKTFKSSVSCLEMPSSALEQR